MTFKKGIYTAQGVVTQKGSEAVKKLLAATSAIALYGLCSLPFIAATMSPAVAQAQKNEDCNIRFNYDDADLSAMVDQLAMDTGRVILVDRSVNGKSNISAPRDVTMCPEEAWSVFQEILRLNGFAATPIGDNKYKIIPLAQAQRAPGPVGKGAEAGSLVTRIFRLQHIDAQDAARNIAQFNSEGAVATAIRSSNALIVVDTTGNMERIAGVLRELDRDTREFRTIGLINASARDVARVLSDVAQDLSDESSGSVSKVSIVPVDASNTVLIRAEPVVMSKLANVVRELDRAGENSDGIAVYRLEHADADDVLPLLQEIIGQPASGSAAAAPGNGASSSGANQVIISSYSPNNSIIVRGDKSLQREIETIIAEIDVRRAQVLVEAIIVDISDTTAREIGVQYFLSGNGDNLVPFSTNVSGQSPNILSAAGAAFSGALGDGATDDTGATDDSGILGPDFTSTLTAAAVSSLLGINGFGLGGAGQFGDSGVFGALLTAIKQDSSSRVLSTPSVVTLDNQTASLSDGQEIPITNGEQIGDDFTNAFRTVTREQVGIILEVTPQINQGGTVLMEIRQEISSVAGPIIATSTDLITNNSEISTTAIVDDGDILVIGGLISDDLSVAEDKVPFLGDIPAIGNLFKTSSRSKRRNNLMIFIRPTIIRDQVTARRATQRKFDYVRGQDVLNSDRAKEDFDRLLNDITGVPVENR